MSEYKKIIYKTTIVSVLVNIFLTVIKIVVGFITHSLSLFSDGIHSLCDILTDIGTYLGVRFANKPPDKNHHYGHGKYETFSEIIISIILLSVALAIISYGFKMLFSSQTTQFNKHVLLIASLSVIIKEFLYRWLKKIGNNFQSRILLINAWHHRSDALSSLAVIIGSMMSFWGIKKADYFTGIVVGIIILITAMKFIAKSLSELAEISPGKDIETKVKNIIKSFDDVKSYHKIRIRKLGNQIFMDMHILVEPNMNIKQAHNISTQMENHLKRVLGMQTNILIHIEPFEAE